MRNAILELVHQATHGIRSSTQDGGRAVVLIVSLGLCCAARAQMGSLGDLESKARQLRHPAFERFHQTEVKPDDIMDVVFDLKKAAQSADELQSDGAKCCHWGKAQVDASDLGVAISRHLLNRGTLVPDHIFASKMWPISFIAANLLHQLDMGGAQCAVLLRQSADAHTLYGESASAATRLQDLTVKFYQLATRQTLWQEEVNFQSLWDGQRGDPETFKVHRLSVLAAAHEMKEAVEFADKTVRESVGVRQCSNGEGAVYPPVAISALQKGIEHDPDGYFLLAGDMSNAYVEAEYAALLVESVLMGCSTNAAEHKKARKIVYEALAAHHRLLKAIVEFEPLIVQQAEWEEQMIQKQVVIQEH